MTSAPSLLSPVETEISVRGRRVVVVDDKESVRSMLRDLLQANGIEVRLASSGAVALELIREERPDLVLSDINMEGLDGFELLELVRRDPSTAQLPFVLMTGKADFRSMRNGMSRGADDYLPKPFSMGELLQVIKQRLARQAACAREAENRLASLRNNLALMLPHELLTPLNGIIGVATLLEAGGASDEDLEDYSDMLRESGERLHRVILNFLTLARLEILAQEAPHRRRMLADDSCSIEDWVLSLANGLAKKRKRAEDLEASLHPMRLRISRQDLAKVLSEILDNAFKFSKAGSKVTLRCTDEGASGAFTVQDRGRGMNPEQLDSIGAFQQFDRKLHEQQGTGLGVVIAKRFVELHGGVFEIESTVNAGTTVRFSLPRAEG